MPLYEFRCPWCHLVYEELRAVGDFESYCPNCEAIKSEKLISRFAVQNDSPTSQQRASSILRFGRDPSSRSEIRRMEKLTGRKIPESKEEFGRPAAEKKKFQLTDDQRREAIGMIRGNRDAAKIDQWRMEYTKNPEVIKAAEEAAEGLTKNVGKN